MGILFRWFAVAIGFMAAAYFVPGITLEGGFPTAILLAAVWGLIGMLVRPILIILTLPVTILTFGLFIFVINAGLLWWVGDILENFRVDGFFAAVLGSIVLSAVSSVVHWILERLRGEE